MTAADARSIASRLSVPTIFLLGSIGGGLCDQIHVQFGVIEYASKDIFGQSWWVAPQFGLAALLILAGSRGQGGPVRTGVGRVLAWFALAYFATGVVGYTGVALAGFFFASFVVRMVTERRSGKQIAWALGLALVGCTYESLLSSTGLFWYTQPHLYGIPAWLFGLYLHGAPVVWELRALPDVKRDDASA